MIGGDGVVYVQARRHLLALNPDVSVKWNFVSDVAPANAHYSSPAIDPEGRIYWGMGDARVVCAVGPEGAFLWSYKTGGQVQSSPSIGSDDSIYVGSYDNNFYAFTSAGALSWSYLTAYHILSSPAIDDSGRIYVGSEDNRLRVFTAGGALVWVYEAKYDIDSSPAIGSDGVA